MSLEKTIIKGLQELPPSEQAEALNFIDHLKTKSSSSRKEGKNWSAFSLSSAMRGMEYEETPYSIEDLKEAF